MAKAEVKARSMKAVFSDIEDRFYRMQYEAEEAIGDRNASAALRSRKVSLELEKLLKEWRKVSVEHFRK